MAISLRRRAAHAHREKELAAAADLCSCGTELQRQPRKRGQLLTVRLPFASTTAALSKSLNLKTCI
jgi:hypothetical protein